MISTSQGRHKDRDRSSAALPVALRVALPGSCQSWPLTFLCSSYHAYLWASRDVKRRNSSAENGYSFYDIICQLGAVGDIQVFQDQWGFAVCLEEISGSQVCGGLFCFYFFFKGVCCLFVCFPLLSLSLFPNTLSIWNHFTCCGLFSIHLGLLNTYFFSMNKTNNKTLHPKSA